MIRHFMYSAKVIYMAMQPRKQYTKQASARETFNIRQKLDLFGLHSYASIDKAEIFRVLGTS